jgi:Kef-type K+ transport system membrane component KefB/nucleotide-binding universal stress UspA family protein
MCRRLMAQTVLKGLEHHAVFLLLLQLCVLLAVARLMGEIMRKLKQPPVVGELVAGVLLGPSVFGLAWPDLQTTIFPPVQAQADLLAVVAWLGVLFLLIVTGLETDVRLILERGRTALMISAGGIIIPFGTGIVLGFSLPDEFLTDPDVRLMFALFMAVAMSISAVPVIAKVLFDLKLIRRDIGQLTLAAAMTDDTIGWILLSVVAGLATRGSVDLTSVLFSVGTAVVFLAFAFTIGGRLVSAIMSFIDDVVGGASAQFSVILVLALGAAAFTQEMGIEAVLGAFVIGILAGRARRFRNDVAHVLEVVTAGFVAPIFFASAGLKVDLVRLFEPRTVIVGAIVLAIACFGKFFGCYFGGWLGGLSHWERIAMGAGMNARGAMEIIVATVGLGLGVLTREMYAVIVMVAIVTSLMAPPLLRWSLSRVSIGEAEAKRLENEEAAASSFVRSIRRVLLVARSAEQAELAARLVGLLSRAQPTEVTAYYANLDEEPVGWWQLWTQGSRQAWQSFRDNLRGIRRAMAQVEGASAVKVASGSGAIDQVLHEAARGYDLIVMAVGRPPRSEGPLFGRSIDRIVREAPCSTLVLKGRFGENGESPKVEPLRKILVPTIGTDYSKNAMEVASVLARVSEGKVTALHVIARSQTETTGEIVKPERAKEIADEIVEFTAGVGRKLGAEVETIVAEGPLPESEILETARAINADLIFIGTSLRTVRQRAFFGHRAEALLRTAPCAVAVVSTT